MGWLDWVNLEGRHARLAPLEMAHGPALADAARDGELWRLWYTRVHAPDEINAEIERRLRLFEAGSMLPFTVFDRRGVESGGVERAVGMTTYMNVDAANRRVEIGSTWYAQSAQRSAINTECKLLLLQHAFDHLECIAVEFRTHRLNQQSRRAIERLGAQLDGILRCHQVLPDGSLRDTAVYSITASEWPAVRNHLRFMLDSHEQA